jgi:RNA polymerase sigma-70 factor (ECF subfamily)
MEDVEMNEYFDARIEDISIQRFEEIYDRHINMLHRVCLSYMKNTPDAEDIVSDVFVKLLNSGKTFQSMEHEKAWLLRTAINLCKDNLKHWWHNRANIDDYSSLESAVSYSGDETLKIVMGLPERYKAAIYLHYYEGYSSAEIAGILKKPQSTILNHLHEARKLLKEVLSDEE